MWQRDYLRHQPAEAAGGAWQAVEVVDAEDAWSLRRASGSWTSQPSAGGKLHRPRLATLARASVAAEYGGRQWRKLFRRKGRPDKAPNHPGHQGPFQIDAEGYRGGLPTLLYRPETWTKVSNIIFIDAPVGAGFSYATSEEGLKTSDTMAVKKLVVFLKKWLHEHPKFLSNPLYIGGESFCGITIPALALEIDISNKKSGDEPLLNLKGYFAGNPSTDVRFDVAGRIHYLYRMGMLSDELHETAEENCRGNYSDPPNALCAESIQAINDCTKDINIFYILEPTCKSIWSPRIQQVAARSGTSGPTVEYSAGVDLLFPFKCRSDSYQLSYIWANDERVRYSLGVRKGTKGEWLRCKRDIPYTRDIPSTIEIHSRLHKEGYPALIYNGDHDSAVPFVGTEAWIRSLNLPTTDDWRPWYVDGQIAGFTRSFSSILTYATVKGAGHTAPEYKAKECLTMFARWISGDPL
ncbi:unnamed protein product [Alopecurus aequalis]